MRRDIENTGIAVEGVLRPVAVVNVPIHHQDALEAVPLTQMGSGDGDVVEQAETHGAIALGVVAGRANEGKAVAESPRHHLFAELEQAADGQQGGGERSRRHGGIGVEGVALEIAGALDAGEVVVAVHQGHLIGRRQARRETAQTRPFAHRGQQDGDALGALGVTVAGVVLRETLVEDESRVTHGRLPSNHS